MILTALDIIIIVGSLVVTILLGLFWGPKEKTESDDNDDDPETSKVEDYILAKNQIGWLATGASLAASWSSAFGLIAVCKNGLFCSFFVLRTFFGRKWVFSPENFRGFLSLKIDVSRNFDSIPLFVSAPMLTGLPVQLMVSGVVIYGASMVAFVVAILLITTYVIPVILDNNLPSVFSLLKYKYGEDNCKLAMFFSLPFKFMLGGCQMYTVVLKIFHENG